MLSVYGKMLFVLFCLYKIHDSLECYFLADRTIGRAYGTVCRLSVCLSVCLSVTFCIVAKWYVLAKKCLKE